jgi:hypothetical protein
MMRHLRCLACLCLLWIGPVSFSQVITIRVINGKNGRPLPKKHIMVSLRDENNGKGSSHMQLETDVRGEARFTLPDPVPARLSVVVFLKSRSWRCGCSALVATQEVIQKGLAKGQAFTGAAIPVVTAPGEISFAAHRRPFFDWLLLTLFAPLLS